MIADPPVRGKQKPGKQKTSAAAAERHEGAHVVEPLEIQRRLFEREDLGARQGAAGVVAELLHHLEFGEGLSGPASVLRLVRFHHPSVHEAHPHSPGKGLWKGRVRIHRIAHPRGESEERGVPAPLGLECPHSHPPLGQRRRHGKGRLNFAS